MNMLFIDKKKEVLFEDIIKKRTQPGILIFNRHHELVFINSEAVTFLKGINRKNETSKNPDEIPDEIFRICRTLKKISASGSERPCCNASIGHDGQLYSIRALPLFHAGRKNKSSHTMVIIERCTPRRNIDIEKVKAKFNLAKREAEVVEGIVKGFTNREIASALFLSEYTVKDYIKKIMNKLGVKCRTLIFCRVIE